MNFLTITGQISRLAFIGCLFPVMAMAGEESETGSDSNADNESVENVQLENCIRRQSIRNTYIVDDKTVIFYMHQQKIYVNELPNRCSGLRSARTFSYRTTGSQLCNVDTIKVIRSMGGRIDAGPTCGLGKFRPVTKDEVEKIRNKDKEETVEEALEADSDEDTAE